MNSFTTLFRQVHPNFMQEGELTSQAFMPFPKDEGRLSVYDGDQISAMRSFAHYTEVLGLKSDSVWGVTCTEVSEIGLTSSPDPSEGFPEHAVVDFSGQLEKDFRKLAKKLKSVAVTRGRLHP